MTKFRKLILLLGFTLICTQSALAAAWIPSGPTAKANVGFDQSFNWRFSADNEASPLIDMAPCSTDSTRPTMTVDSSSDAQIVLFGCDQNAAAVTDDSCRPIQGLPASGPFGPTNVSFNRSNPKAFAFVKENGTRTFGTVTLACSNVASKTYSQGAWQSAQPSRVLGVSNGIANETGLARLQNVVDIAAPPAQSRTRVYISAAGNDASDGRTEATAWKTWDKVGDEWAAIGCGLEVVTLPAGGAWDTDAEWGTGCATGSANCGISGDGTVANCSDPNALSLWIHSKDNSIATLDATALTNEPGGTSGALGIFDTRPASDKGWVVIEDMTVIGRASGLKENFHAGIFGKMVVLNSPNNSVSPGGTSQAFSATEPSGNAQMVILGNVSVVNAGSVGGRLVFTSQDNRLTLIGNGGAFSVSGTANNAMFEVNTRSRMTVFGVNAIGGSATPQGFMSNPSSGTGELDVVRSVFDGSANAAAIGLDVRVNADNETAIVKGYQVTLTNGHATATGKLVTNEAAPANATRVPIIECWDCILGAYAGAGANPSMEIFGAASSTPFRGRLIVDEGASSAPYRLNATNYTTFALLQSAAAGAWPELAIADDNTSVQWGTNNNYGCLLTNTCSKSTSSDYTIPLAAPIPSFVLGEGISAIRLNEAVRNYGAR